MKIKIISINLAILFILYLITDVIFSRFIFKQSVDHKCYEHMYDGTFYKMRKNCYSNMRLISSIDSFKVFTDKNSLRYSGNKRVPNENNIIFLGDSQTFGVGSDWQNTFIGILEKNLSNYNLYNLGVPSYSPSVYDYSLKKFLGKKKIEVDKIFVLIDLTDVSDEANRWEINDNIPKLTNEKIFYKKNVGFSKFKKENFKGLYLISSKIRSFFRNINKEKKNKQNQYRPVDGNPTGAFIYTDHKALTGCNNKNKKTEWWRCGGVKIGLNKIEKNIIELGKSAKKLNSEFYIIIMPWPDSLKFGQTKLNWEKFNSNLCLKAECTKLINLFPKFKNLKQTNKDWLKILYLNNDIHLTKKGNMLVADQIINNVFN